MEPKNDEDNGSIINRGWPTIGRTPTRESVWATSSFCSPSRQQANLVVQNNETHQGSVPTNNLPVPQSQFFTPQTNPSGPQVSFVGWNMGDTSRPHNPFDIHHPADLHPTPWTNPFAAMNQPDINPSVPGQFDGPTPGFGNARHSSSFPGQTSAPRSSWQPHIQAALDMIEDEVSITNTTHGYSGSRGLTARETITTLTSAINMLQRQHPGSVYDCQLVQRRPDGSQVSLQNVGESYAPTAPQVQDQSRSGAGSMRRTRRGRGGRKTHGEQDYGGIKKQKNKKHQKKTTQSLPKIKTETSQDLDLTKFKKVESESEVE